MPDNAVILTALAVTALVVSILMEQSAAQKRTKAQAELTRALLANDYGLYDSLLKKYAGVFPPFNAHLLELRGNIARNSSEAVRRNLAAFENSRMNEKEKEIVYSEVLNFAAMSGDRATAEHCQNRIHATANTALIHKCDILYDCYVLKGHQYFDELMADLEKAGNAEKGSDELLLSQMYANMGNQEKAAEFEQKSKAHFESQMNHSTSEK